MYTFPSARKNVAFVISQLYALGLSNLNSLHSDNLFDTYINFLAKEIEFLGRNYNFIFDNLKSIYFGGGTPSLLPTHSLNRNFDNFTQKILILRRTSK